MLDLTQLVGPLKLIATLANDMEECNDMCKHVHARMTVIHDKLLAMETQKTLPPDAVVRDYSALVNDFTVFLTKHKSRPWVYRVVMAKRVTGKVKNFQERITTLKLALDLIHSSAMADERVAMEGYRTQQAAHDADMIAKLESAVLARLTDDATVTKAVLRVEQQVEALSVLVHELDKLGGPDAVPDGDDDEDDEDGDATSANERLLKTALDKVIRRSKVQVHAVPGWFCPPHDVEFDVSEPFAGGSFGTVHYGRMNHMDVVVKCLLVDARTNENAMKQFREEASLWFGFRHRHVLAMYGACDVSSPPFIVCELAVNGNLANYLSFERNRAQTFRLLHDAASGLAYLHSKRVVHGDLKGDNILVTADGCAKVADFSFSYVRAMSASRNSLALSSAAGAKSAGAIRWRAPECLRGRSPTFASDVFSLGMCILEVVGQTVPWGHRVDDLTVRELVKEGELPERPADMSDDVWDLVTRMCSLEPSKRPSLADVLTELRELAGDDLLDSSEDLDEPDVAAVTVADLVGGRAGRSRHNRSSTKTLEQVIADDDAESIMGMLLSASSLEEPVDSTWYAPPLIVAAAMGATNVTKMLLARGASVSALLKVATTKLPDLDDTGCTALHIAALAGHAHIVEVLLSAKRDLASVVTEKQRNALHFAVRFGHVAVIDVLVRFGADLSACDAGRTALAVAAEFGQTECIRALLLQHKVSAHAKNGDGATALHRAAANGHVDVIEELLQHSARIEEPTNYGATPLIESVTHGQLDCTRLLLKHKANVHAKMNDASSGRTALHEAAFKGEAAILEVLLRHGARIEALDNEGSTPLAWAASFGHLDCVRVLLEHKANIHAKSHSDAVALHKAVAKGHVAIVEELLRRGARIEALDNGGLTPLHWSATHGQLECARVLLKHKANVNVKCRTHGSTALHQAVAKGHAAIAEELLRYGARIEMKSKDDGTPLYWSVTHGQLECTRVLLKHKANVHAKLARRKDNSLHQAASLGYVAIIEELLRHGARIEDKSNRTGTALHWASFYGKAESIRVLLRHSANIKAKDASGASALNVAAQNGHVNAVQVLLAAGAVVTKKDVKAAEQNGHTQIAELLAPRATSLLTRLFS